MDEQTAKALQKIQEVNTTQSTTVEVKKQPQPQTMNYKDRYEISDLFIEHLKTAFKHMPHYKAYQYIKYAEDHKDGISIIDLNGYIKKLDMLEYCYVNEIMANIKSDSGQRAYFIPIQN